MRLLKPRVYQEVRGVKTEIDARYRLTRQQVGIELGSYDVARALTIDPVIIYSATFGGSMGEYVSGIAVDSQGNAYVAGGQPSSPNFPVTPGAFQTQAGESLPFITKLNTTGTAIVYSTYFGGTGDIGQSIFDIAVDAGGNAFVVGSTSSSNFPVTSNAFQRQYNGGLSDAFVTKLNAAGNGLVYSTYLGGTNNDDAHGMSLDATGHAYVAGFTLSGDFPVTPAAFQSTLKTSAAGDAFVAKLDLEGAALVYSTFLGGTGYDSANALQWTVQAAPM